MIKAIILLELRLAKLKVILFNGMLRRVFLKYLVMGGVEHRATIELTRPATVVDIGANRGQFALASRAFSDAKVYSFEPLHSPAMIFKSIFAKDKLVSMHQVAIGPKSCISEMHVSARDDSSSLLPITHLQSSIFLGTNEVAKTMVEVGPLDSYINVDQILAPALLKIDVQGFEYQVLCGCESLISDFSYVYCECSFVEFYAEQKLAGDIIYWLSHRGFELYGIYNSMSDNAGRILQADFLFKKSETHLLQ